VTVGSPAQVTRRLALTGAVLAAAFAALLGLVLAAHGQPRGWDLDLHSAALDRRSAALTAVATALSATTQVLAYLLAAIGGLLALRPRPWWLGALAGAAALGAGQLVRFALSVAVGRARPPRADWAGPASGYAFPSGHTTTATLAAGLLCLGLVGILRGAWRSGAVGLATAWAAAVGVSRVYLGVHWPTDVLGGWLLGGLLTLLAAALARTVGSGPREQRRGGGLPGRARVGDHRRQDR
jgi:membrane-associated phospholipid phosphatase